MFNNDRYQFDVIVGSDTAEINDFLAMLSHRFGGCTYSKAIGTWAEDGASFQTEFGAYETETAHKFEIVVSLDNARQAYEDIKAYCAACFKGSANWVHVAGRQVAGLHFSIDAMETENKEMETAV